MGNVIQVNYENLLCNSYIVWICYNRKKKATYFGGKLRRIRRILLIFEGEDSSDARVSKN